MFLLAPLKARKEGRPGRCCSSWERGEVGNSTYMHTHVYMYAYVSSVTYSTSSILGSESISDEAMGGNTLGLESGLESQLCCYVNLVTCAPPL